MAGDVRALQQQLTRQLAQSAEAAVGAACDELQKTLVTRAAAAAAEAKAKADDCDVCFACCQRLVTYIAANMATSPDFAQQM